jgi:hypothetical protein
MSKPHLHDDGSVIEWVDKETLRYTENGFSVSIWVDFEPGFFNSRRIIKSSSIVRWDIRPEGCSDAIGMDKRNEILAKVQQYYQSQNRKFRNEGS